MMLKQLIEYLYKLKETGYTEEELLPLINETFSEYTKANIEEKTINNILNLFFEACSTMELKIEETREKVLLNSMQQYSLTEHEDFLMIKNHLLKLSYYDKIIYRDGKDYFFLIDLLMKNYLLHFDALKTYDELKKKNDIDLFGVALSTSTTPKAIISRHHNNILATLKSMPENRELIVRDKVYNEYLDNPYVIDNILHTVKIIGNIKSLSSEENNFIHNSRVVINSALPIKKKDILKSANLLLPLLFKSNSRWVKILNINKKISLNKIIETNELLMQYLFETKNILNNNNLKKNIQVKTNFANTPLYEFQNNKNKKVHPMLEETKENQEFFNEILELIKGKIPLK